MRSIGFAAITTVLLTASISAQSIVTVAGGGTDDGRPATAAGLYAPLGLAFDSAGNLFIADHFNHRIRRVSAATGLVTTVAGNGARGYSGDGGPAVAAGIAYPRDIQFDRAGNLYIIDRDSYRVRRIDATTGKIGTVAGNGAVGFSGDGGLATAAAIRPNSIALDAAGNLFIAEYSNSRIRRVDTRGIITTFAYAGTTDVTGDGGPAAAAGGRPYAIAFDRAGDLLVSDAYRIRRIRMATQTIETIAGTGKRAEPTADAPAISSALGNNGRLFVDPAGNIYFTDSDSFRVYRIDGAGKLTVFAGNGSRANAFCGSFSGDGGPASQAGLASPSNVAFDAAGNAYISDSNNQRIRRVSAENGVISTFAGNGTYGFSGDGGPATATVISFAFALAFDKQGDLYIADAGADRIRRVSATTGAISTFAGNGDFNGECNSFGDGKHATEAGLFNPDGLLFDNAGNLYIADTYAHRVRRVDAKTGIITTIAGTGATNGSYDVGTFSGDGGPAVAAGLNLPVGLAIDAAGDLYIGDSSNHRVRKVSTATGVITTVAGTGAGGYNGDNVPAAGAQLCYPEGLAFDAAGDLHIADYCNGRVRKISRGTGQISTVVGSGTRSHSGDGGPATAAGLGSPSAIAFDRNGSLYLTDNPGNRVRKVTNGTITTIAGTGSFNATGDGGPATSAGLNNPFALAVNDNGDVFIGSSGSVRAVYRCTTVAAPVIQQPTNGSTVSFTQAKLAWSAVKSAFRYDVYLDTVNPPKKIVATDIAPPTYSPASLEPLTTYYWKVVAKGDPFCSPAASASTEVLSFTTSSACSSPGSFNASASFSGSTVTIQWQPAARAETYDVAFGTAAPPRIHARGIRGTSVAIDNVAGGTTYYWSVTAHAECDSARRTETGIETLTTAGGCVRPATPLLSSPGNGASSVSGNVTLTWTPSAAAASYDVYLGHPADPPLYVADVREPRLSVSRLTPGAEYGWKIVARAACDPTQSQSSEVRRFTPTVCSIPERPALTAPPPTVPAGATYALSWSDAGLDEAGSYLIERASDPGFQTLVDRQETTSTSASFMAMSEATYYHLVRSVAGCDRTRRSEPSDTVLVTAKAAAPMVVFTLLPQAVMTRLGDRLEDQRTFFALENLSPQTVQVLVGPQLLGSVPFFTVLDPLGGDSSFVTLPPRQAKTFEIRFSGPPVDRAGAYQGSIYVSGVAQALAFTPQAYVSLRVGGEDNAPAPRLLVNGAERSVALFEPATGDDSARRPLLVDLLNSGTTPMEVVAEIGPEAWLTLEKDWNLTAIAPSSARTLRLSTQRSRAVAGSALPRYTYLTVRNKAGQSARLLVQDTGGIVAGRGRPGPLGAGDASLIVPMVRSGVASQSAVIVANTGNADAPLEMIWTPEGSDGFDQSAVKRAAFVVPANDVVTLTDVVGQLFGVTADGYGSLEIRGAAERMGSLVVRTEVVTLQPGGQSYRVAVPAADRGEGARTGNPQRINGIASSGGLKTSVVLTETSGRDTASVKVSLHDGNGVKRGEQTLSLARYGTRRFDDVAQTFAGGGAIDGGYLEVNVGAGGGSVIGVAVVADRNTGSGAATISQPVAAHQNLSALSRTLKPETLATGSATVQTLSITGIVSDDSRRATVGVSAASPANIRLTYRDGAKELKKDIVIAAGQTIEYRDVLRDLWSESSGRGALTITSDAFITAYGRLRTDRTVDALPVLSVYSEALSGSGSSKLLIADGLEQSIEPGQGRTTGLVVSELSGQSARFSVRLYAPGNRSLPIAEREFAVAANGQLNIDNLFESMGLQTGSDVVENRRKNQVNVAAVLTPKSGGLLSAAAILTDGRSGERQTILFVPAGGVPATTPQKFGAATAAPSRRRAARP